MNKKGAIVTLISFKKYVLFYLFLFLLILGLIYVLPKIRTITDNVSCESLIPDRIKLSTPNSDMLSFHSGTNEKWLDGAEIISFFCFKGNKEGENINYFYCKNIYYSNKPITPEGNVGKEIKFKINLVVDPNNVIDENYKIVGYNCNN